MHTKNNGRLGLAGLVGLSAGSSIASGVFVFSGDFAAAGAGTAAVLAGWLIAGAGMLAIVMCFFGLGRDNLQLQGGIYSYAQKGLGSCAAFYTIWSYWLAALFGNLSFLSLLAASVSYFLEIQNSIILLAGQSILIWSAAAVLLRGTERAARVNLIVAAAKLLPLIAFASSVVFFGAFDLNTFTDNFWGQDTGYSLPEQIKATTGIALWAFVGIEGAVAVSARARRPKDVGKALVLSFLCVLSIYVIVSGFCMGVMPRQQLASLGNPPLAYVFANVVGKPGAVIVNAGIILALGGAYLGYNLLAAEAMAAASKQGAFTELFGKANKNGSPAAAILLTCCAIQIFTIVFTLTGVDYQSIYVLAARLSAPVYFAIALCCLRMCLTGQRRSPAQYAAAIVGTAYGLYMMYCMGIGEIFTMALFFVPGAAIYICTKKEKNQRLKNH